MATEDTSMQAEPITQAAGNAIHLATKLLDQERQHNGLGARGRALSTAITKLDEARMWLAEAERF